MPTASVAYCPAVAAQPPAGARLAAFRRAIGPGNPRQGGWRAHTPGSDADAVLVRRHTAGSLRRMPRLSTTGTAGTAPAACLDREPPAAWPPPPDALARKTSLRP